MNTCPECSAVVTGNVSICPSCGTALSATQTTIRKKKQNFRELSFHAYQLARAESVQGKGWMIETKGERPARIYVFTGMRLIKA